MNKKQKTYLIVGILVVAGLGFAGGYAYGKNRSGGTFAAGMRQFSGTTAGGMAGGAQGGQRNFRGGAGGGLVMGSIVSKDATSITVNMQGGAGSKVILIGNGTQIMKSVSGTADDLAAGSNVVIMGSANADGSISAQSIQIRPVMANVGTTTAKTNN